MNFELKKIQELSGNKCQIYSAVLEGESMSLFESFLATFYEDYTDEVQDIYDRLKFIGREGGARSQFLKMHEGTPGDGVCALYDIPNKRLRLYCIVYGTVAVILGGGGIKRVRVWQDDEFLRKHAELMIRISRIISLRIIEGDIKISDDGFTGNIKINEDYDE